MNDIISTNMTPYGTLEIFIDNRILAEWDTSGITMGQ